jgi:autotransporter-associated beta strand protein
MKSSPELTGAVLGILMTAGIAGADTTDREVRWTGHSSSDWMLNLNWIDPVSFDPTLPTTNDVVLFSDLFTADDFQPAITGTNVWIDEIIVGKSTGAPATDVVITVDDGTLNLDRYSQNVNSINMDHALKALIITGSGNFVQKGQYNNTSWIVTENTVSSSQGGLIIDTAGFLIEDTTLTIDTALRRKVQINSSAGASAAGIFKTGNGRLILGGTNAWTGDTVIDDGRFVMATHHPLSPRSALVFNDTAILEPGGFDAAFSTLEINGSVRFDFKNQTGSELTFADSSGIAWSSPGLAINNFTEGVNSIRFGTGSSALTPEQLAHITINGITEVMIDTNGYIHTEFRVFPEPDLQSIGELVIQRTEPEGTIQLSWNSSTNGQIYQVEYRENLATGDWLNYTNVIGSGTNGIFINLPADLSGAFFHVLSEGFEGF